jgi:hypothetical protein
MLTQNAGEAVFTGARIDIKFVNILWPNAEIEVSGVRAVVPVDEFERSRYPFALRILDQDGRATVVAEGSYVEARSR